MAIIEKLHILRFRNLDNQYLEPNTNINLFIGGNGQGKTNLIEALYYLGHSRSFKSKNIKDVVPFEKAKRLCARDRTRACEYKNTKYVNVQQKPHA